MTIYSFLTNYLIVGDYKLGKLLNEGKTKQIYDLPDNPGHVLLMNKDRITALNGVSNQII